MIVVTIGFSNTKDILFRDYSLKTAAESVSCKKDPAEFVSIYGRSVVAEPVVGATVVSIAVVGNSVVGAGVVVMITEPQRTGARTRSSQVGSLGWKQSEPSALLYIPKHTGMVCQSLQ